MTHKRVGPLGGEVAVHEIRRPRRVGISDRREHLAPPAGDPFDLHGPHQTGDLVPADVVTGAARCLPQLVGAVDLRLATHNTIKACISTASRTARADG